MLKYCRVVRNVKGPVPKTGRSAPASPCTGQIAHFWASPGIRDPQAQAPPRGCGEPAVLSKLRGRQPKETAVPEPFLTIDPTSATPPFEQIRTKVIDAVRAGRLEPGTRLPTVRGLADELGLATNTVARAYRELERDDVIQTRGRFGSFIAANGDAAHRHAQAAATAFADRIEKLGIDPAEALALVTRALEREPHANP